MADKVDASENRSKAPEPRPSYSEIKFIYTKHGFEDIDEIWEKVKDSDVVLMECIVSSEESKKNYNYMLFTASDSRNPEIKKKIIDVLDPPGEKHVAEALMRRFLEAGKEIWLIDMPRDSLEGKLGKLSKELRRRHALHSLMAIQKKL
jgi:hypothetical protein